MLTQIQVEGPSNEGTVHVHMIKPLDESSFQYRLLALDVRGEFALSIYVVVRC
jgi:mitochondrial import inner membrane translocase subunit TIM21